MFESTTLELVVWRLAGRRYALPLSVVERVLPASEVTPLPDAPELVSGILNFQGRVVPVVDMRRRLALPQRELQLADRIVLARTARRALAFCVDAVLGVVEHKPHVVVPARSILPGLGCVAGVVKLADGLILVHDLDRLLSLDEERELDHALARTS